MLEKSWSMNFLHSKDLGDIILSLASVQASGGGNFYIKNNPYAVMMLSGLIEIQPYIGKCGEYSNQNIDKSFVDFRQNGHPFGKTLAELHANWINQPVDFSKKWLFCPEDKKFSGSIIVNKTSRYNNPLFPWKELTNILKDKMLFVGSDLEYKIFCNRNGKIDRLKINNYLDLAIAINSCECFIGNQSSPNCIAEGLKHNSILEVCLKTPDCIFKRYNTYYSYDGSIKKKINGLDINIPPKEIKEKLDKSECPVGGWIYELNNKTIKSHYFDYLIQLVIQEGVNKTKAEIEDKIFNDTSKDIPLSINNQLILESIQKVKCLFS